MVVLEVVVTVALIVMAIARLAWVEGGASKGSYSGWHRRHTLDVGIVVFTVLFAAVTLFRFLTIG